MKKNGNGKSFRILDLYTRMMKGEILDKKEEAHKYGVDEKSIQRDIEEIKNYFSEQRNEQGQSYHVVYDREKKGYRIEQDNESCLSKSEVLAICKILLESRAFKKVEMEKVLKKIIRFNAPVTSQESINKLIKDELYHYVELRHGMVLTDKIWEIGQAIFLRKYIEIEYTRPKDKALVSRKLKPAAIMFSEYYFYLTAFIENEDVRNNFENPKDPFPTIYRMDRIKSLKVLNEKYTEVYKTRFDQGEFRKRIQFMYGGALKKVTFNYSGYDVDVVLDRLPTAKIVSVSDGIYEIEAEIFGTGIDMWIRSQGEFISKFRYL